MLTVYMPNWVMWLIGIPLLATFVFCAFVGFLRLISSLLKKEE